jgi:signal transduction histidine kinase
VHRIDLLRTTSFRLAVLFLALFSAASLVLFGVVYLQTHAYLVGEVDDWLGREQAGLGAETPYELAQRMTEHLVLDPQNHRPFSLLDGSGRVIVGSPLVPLAPISTLDEPFDFTATVDDEPVPYRGLAHRQPSGNILLVSQDLRDLNQFRDRITDAMTSGWVIVLVVGLIGAATIGVGALRRIEAMTRSIERIVMGDLSQRLPVQSRSGDLDRLSAIVNRMLDEIQRLMNEVKGVTDDIAHDLRTPLTRLLGGLERERQHKTKKEEEQAAIDEAIMDTQGLLRTFRAMLRISEIEDSARRAGFGTVDLFDVLSDVVELYAPLAEEKGVGLSIAAAPARPVTVGGDSSLLFEAVANLVDNAIKFTPAGGAVSLRAFRTAGRVGITVSDTGPGIPAGEREAVLRRFYRVERSRHTQGNGLGLSLVAAVAKLHDLSLTIEDGGPGCSMTLARDEEPAAVDGGRPATPAGVQPARAASP